MNDQDPRPHKAAEDLDDRDRIWADGAIREVRHVEPFTLSTTPKVAVIVAGGTCYTWPSRSPVAIATDEDMAAAEAAERRRSLVKGIYKLADLMSKQALPVPTYGTFDFNFALSSEAEVRAWASGAGVPVIDDENSPRVAAEWAWPSLDVPSYERLIEVRVHASRDKKSSAEVSTPSAAGAQEGTPAAPSGGPARTGSPDTQGHPLAPGEVPVASVPQEADATGATNDSPAGRDLTETSGPAVATAGPSGDSSGEVETGQGTLSQSDPFSARDSASPGYDRHPTVVLAEGQTYAEWYEVYARSLDERVPGWYRDTRKMAGELRELARARRNTERIARIAGGKS